MIKAARWLWRAGLFWLAGKFLEWSVALHPEPFNAYILERSTVATFQAVKQNLRARGTRLCEACTSTRGPLKRVGGVFACPAPLNQVRAQEAEKQRRAALPPQAAHA